MKSATDLSLADVGSAVPCAPTAVNEVLLTCPLCRAQCPATALRLGDAPCPNCRQELWVMRDGGRVDAVDARLVPEEARAWLQSVFSQLEIESIEDLDGLQADSLETLTLIMELEDAFEMRVSRPGAADIRTIGDALRYLEGQIRLRQGGGS